MDPTDRAAPATVPFFIVDPYGPCAWGRLRVYLVEMDRLSGKFSHAVGYGESRQQGRANYLRDWVKTIQGDSRYERFKIRFTVIGRTPEQREENQKWIEVIKKEGEGNFYYNHYNEPYGRLSNGWDTNEVREAIGHCEHQKMTKDLSMTKRAERKRVKRRNDE